MGDLGPFLPLSFLAAACAERESCVLGFCHGLLCSHMPTAATPSDWRETWNLSPEPAFAPWRPIVSLLRFVTVTADRAA